MGTEERRLTFERHGGCAKLEGKPERVASSFAKPLFLGEIHEEMVLPWPEPNPDEQDRIRKLNAAAREIGSRMDHRRIEEERWVGDQVVRELGEAGLCGLYADKRYGGQVLCLWTERAESIKSMKIK